MGDHDVCSVTAAGAADQRNDPVIGCEDGRAEGFDEIDARVEMRVGAVGRLEPERARTEGLRDLGLGLWPHESVLGGVTGAGRDLSDVVGLTPQLHLGPNGLHRRRDDRVLLLLQHVGDLLRQLRRLGVQLGQLPPRLRDLRLEL